MSKSICPSCGDELEIEGNFFVCRSCLYRVPIRSLIEETEEDYEVEEFEDEDSEDDDEVFENPDDFSEAIVDDDELEDDEEEEDDEE